MPTYVPREVTGSAVSGLRVPVSGKDPSGLARPFFLDATGQTFSTNATGSQLDGHSQTIGTTTDAESSGTVVGRLRRANTLLTQITSQSLTDNGPFTDGSSQVTPTGYIFDEVSGTALTENDIAVPRIDSKRASVTTIEGTTRGIRAEVKASGSAPTSADQALVVVLSPNQPAIPITSTPATSTNGLSFGDIALSAISTANAVRRTTYTEQTSNFTGSIVSSNVNDTSAGTGARTVRIYYMNAAGTTTGTEDATLNGTTAVNLVTTTKCFIEKMEVLTVGSGGSNAGTITLKTGLGGAGTTVGTISTNNNQTFWAHHYISSGKTCYVTGLAVTINGGGGLFYMRAKDPTNANAVDKQVTDPIRESAQAATTPRALNSPVTIAGPSRLVMYVDTEAGTSLTYRAAFDFYES